tara:strand:- start:207 stop:386 length:180 start_codon:yes stop_codon:yes gene_type:complete
MMMNKTYNTAIKFLRVEVEVRNTPYEKALEKTIDKFELGLNQIACLTETANGVYGQENK